MMTFDLKGFRKRLNLKQTDVAQLFNCVQGNISAIENGKRGLEDYQAEIISREYGEEILKEFIQPKSKELRVEGIKDDDNYRLVPLCSQDVVGGAYNQEADTNGYVIGYMPFVNAGREDIAVQVTNNSMYPTYPPGSIVQIRKLDFWQKYMEFGQVHIIELLDDRRLIKEVRKGSDKEHFKLVSHNKDYDETEVPLDFIRSVWLVLAKYQKVVL